MAKILRCIHSVAPECGGPSYSMLESSKILAKRGHEVTIVTLDKPGAISLDVAPGVELICLGPGLGLFGICRRYLAWLLSNLSKFDAATVHGVWSFSSLGFYLANLRSRTPYLVMPHGSLDVWDRGSRRMNFLAKKVYWALIESRIYKGAKSCFFTADSERVESTRTFSFKGVAHRVVSYGVVDRGTARLESVAADSSTFCYLGRLHEKKGIEVLLDAFQVAFSGDQACTLRIAGTGKPEYVLQLKDRARRLGIEEQIEWVGQVLGAEKESFLADSGLFVLPSHQENFGLAVAEALSCGTPVAVSTGVNTHPLVSAADAGYVFTRDVSSLVSVLKMWRSEGSRDPNVRRRARDCFMQSMSLEAFASDVLASIQSSPAPGQFAGVQDV